LLPFEVQVAKFLPPGMKPEVARLFEGTTAALTNARLDTSKGAQAVSAQLALRKAGEADSLTTSATVALGVDGKCDGPHGVLSFAPTVTDLAVPSVPAWLWRPALLRMVNDQLRARPPLLCVQGPCKKQATIKVPPKVAQQLPPPPEAQPSSCLPASAGKTKGGR
jgi:hypothetical protein